MPIALQLSQRRLLGALAYAIDSADLSYSRLVEAARAYSLPAPGDVAPYPGWTPMNRLSIVTDAWACIDHLSRLRRLVTRFPIGEPRPAEVDQVLADLGPASKIRHRIQHLDEDIFDGKNCTQGHPVLGTVSWIDARLAAAHVHYAISSGPTIDAGNLFSAEIGATHTPGDVSAFRLMAADQTVDLDAAVAAVRTFVPEFEATLRRNIFPSLAAAAQQRGASLETAGQYWPCDMVAAMRLSPEGEAWVMDTDSVFGSVEVSPGVFPAEVFEKD